MFDFKEFFKNKKITVMGIGLLGGINDIIFLAKMGADLIVTDLKPSSELRSSVDKLKKYKNIKLILGEHRLIDFKERDLIIKAPATPLDSIYIQEAKKNLIPVTMWSSFFVKFARDIGALVIGVTGTRGKTTTTHMINQILTIAGKKVILGGNIKGTSILSQLSKTKKDSIILLELDSWKLQGFNEEKISPDVAVFTSFMSDHLNYYQNNLENYFQDKSYIFKYQKNNDLLITNSQVFSFIKKWNFKIKSRILLVDKSPIDSFELGVLGEHNQRNAYLAIAVARFLKISNSLIKKALKDFKGVEGRLQFLRKVNGVSYYNDTTATTPDATIVALKTLGNKNKNIVLIAGGSDKNLDTKQLIKEIKKYCRFVILLTGNGTFKIKDKIKNFKEFDNLKSAVCFAKNFAKNSEVILLSPAFASFGMFKNEYDRGKQFIDIVSKFK